MDASISAAYNPGMDPEKLEKLRRAHAVRRLPDGREGVSVTIQYRGEMPAVPRTARREWLEHEIARVVRSVECEGAVVVPESVSVSGQTMEAIVPAGELENLESRLAAANCRMDVNVRRQVIQPV